jgi:hypothetical protein
MYLIEDEDEALRSKRDQAAIISRPAPRALRRSALPFRFIPPSFCRGPGTRGLELPAICIVYGKIYDSKPAYFGEVFRPRKEVKEDDMQIIEDDGDGLPSGSRRLDLCGNGI